MNAEYVNPFIMGSQRVLATICGERPGLGKVFLKKPPHAPLQVAVSISITGEVKAVAIYTMTPQVGCFLASKMMGWPVDDLDPMAQSAICELGNMISGNVATAFSEKGILADITPPEFHSDSNPALPVDMVCIPLVLQEGHIFEIDVCLT